MLKRIDHIGVVVDDLAEAKRFLSDVLQLPLDRESDQTAQLGVKAAFFRCGDTEIELIEPVTPEVRSQRLGDDKARVEHIAIEVDELGPTMQALEGLGVRVTTDEPLTLGGRVTVFTRPESCDGVMYQFLQYL
jgi:methylmalonyl-CoA/ethylmalonyl-CoA epimerase